MMDWNVDRKEIELIETPEGVVRRRRQAGDESTWVRQCLEICDDEARDEAVEELLALA